jgi:phosphate-selective porin OprO and OprP
LQSEYHWKNINDDETELEHDVEGMYLNLGYFLNEVIPSVPEELELAFRYAFVDEPDSSDTNVQTESRDYT